MGPIGVQEMMVIFLVALVFFGPKKLPELGRLLGKGLTEYRRAKSELKSTFETHLRELEREANLADATKNASLPSPYTPSSYSSTTYDESGYYDSSYSSSSTPSTASATATQDAEANRDSPSSSVAAVSTVAGTVPRSNGVQPAAESLSPAHIADHEGHSA